MSRYERRIYQLGVAFAAVMIIAMTSVLTEECGKNTVYAAAEAVDGNFIDGTATSPEKGQIREDSAMPCVDAESFRRFLETYKQETGEEARTDTVREDHEDVRTEAAGSLPEATAAEVESSVPPLYRISGETIDESLQIRLYQHLQEAGIPWWYEIGLCQMFQESSGNVYAVSKDGRDMGILQFRAQFWDWNLGDIFNADAQMQLYSEQMAARLNAGLSADECISRHKTSDYSTAVDWTYVQQVKQHIPSLEAIR